MLAGIILTMSACGCAASLHGHAAHGDAIRSEVGYFESDGRRIRVDIYLSGTPGPHAAVIVLHGSSGVHSWIPNTATRYARDLARRGLDAFVVHYFDATGTIVANLQTERVHYFAWARVLTEAVGWVSRYPCVDSEHIGLLGHSLGGFLAVGVAASDERIGRIVLFGGALEPFLEDRITRLPPTLVFHGENDGEVPIAEARHLVDFMQARGLDVEFVTYPAEGHTFSDAATSDAIRRAASFLAPCRCRRMWRCPCRGCVCSIARDDSGRHPRESSSAVRGPEASPRPSHP